MSTYAKVWPLVHVIPCPLKTSLPRLATYFLSSSVSGSRCLNLNIPSESKSTVSFKKRKCLKMIDARSFLLHFLQVTPFAGTSNCLDLLLLLLTSFGNNTSTFNKVTTTTTTTRSLFFFSFLLSFLFC